MTGPARLTPFPPIETSPSMRILPSPDGSMYGVYLPAEPGGTGNYALVAVYERVGDVLIAVRKDGEPDG